jgi:hypothetical protein
MVMVMTMTMTTKLLVLCNLAVSRQFNVKDRKGTHGLIPSHKEAYTSRKGMKDFPETGALRAGV